MNWFKNHRLEWIAESLRVYGFINREHLETKFGISTPQASMDLRDFRGKFPKCIKYDKSLKCYLSTAHVVEYDDERKCYVSTLRTLRGKSK
jgi:hypothetical protein